MAGPEPFVTPHDDEFTFAQALDDLEPTADRTTKPYRANLRLTFIGDENDILPAARDEVR